MDNMKEIIDLLVENKKEGKRFSGFAKKLTYGVLIITFLAGVIGSTALIEFKMNDFVIFLQAFAWLFIPLIISIGVNSAIEKHEKAGVEKIEKVKNIGKENGNNK